MPTEVIMPKVDMDMATGKFALWHVKEGGAVAKGAPLFDIQTDKSAMEVERQRIAMISDATVMSNPDSRGTPLPGPPRPVVISRKARSFISRTRRQVMRRGSIFNALSQ